MNKKITIVKAESGEYTDLEIAPGTTARDILATIGLPHHKLSLGEGVAPFADEANVYQEIEGDGTKIYATTPIEVGC